MSKIYNIFMINIILNQMGFDLKQATALKNIFVIAGLIDKVEDFDQRYQNCDKSMGMKPCAASLLNLVKDTQTYLSQRITTDGNTLERWETKEQAWMNHTAIGEIAKTLGFVEEIQPKTKFKTTQKLELIGDLPSSVKPFHYGDKIVPVNIKGSVIVVLGATYGTMLERCKYIAEIESFLGDEEQIGAVVLLGGARRAGEIDGLPHQILKITRDFSLPIVELTETHLIQHALKEVSSNFRANLPPVVVIDTLSSGILRPTTKTTMIEFTKWASANPQVSGAYIISDQPNVLYQEAVIEHIMKVRAPCLRFEVVGSKASSTTTNKDFLEAIAAFMWAKAPAVMHELALTIEDEAALLARQLYKNDPWIEILIEAPGTMAP